MEKTKPAFPYRLRHRHRCLFGAGYLRHRRGGTGPGGERAGKAGVRLHHRFRLPGGAERLDGRGAGRDCRPGGGGGGGSPQHQHQPGGDAQLRRGGAALRRGPKCGADYRPGAEKRQAIYPPGQTTASSTRSWPTPSTGAPILWGRRWR